MSLDLGDVMKALLASVVMFASVFVVADDVYTTRKSLPAGKINTVVEGLPVRITWDEVELLAQTPKGRKTEVTVALNLDLTDLQNRLPILINGRKKYEECGDRVHVSNARIVPADNGIATVLALVTGERWECVKTKIPEVHCEPTRIRIPNPFGDDGWTKGPPRCTTKWEMKTAKTRLLSQSIDLAMQVRPTVKGNAIESQTRVVRANLSGFAGEIVKLFGWENDVRQMVQREVDLALSKRPLHITIPEKIPDMSLQIQSAAFTDRGNNKLGASISAKAQIDIYDLLDLANSYSD